MPVVRTHINSANSGASAPAVAPGPRLLARNPGSIS
jgi:hypothetical protein